MIDFSEYEMTEWLSEGNIKVATGLFTNTRFKLKYRFYKSLKRYEKSSFYIRSTRDELKYAISEDGYILRKQHNFFQQLVYWKVVKPKDYDIKQVKKLLIKHTLMK
jgi:hypothetical protein